MKTPISASEIVLISWNHFKQYEIRNRHVIHIFYQKKVFVGLLYHGEMNRVSKMNAVARAQLAFQLLTLLYTATASIQKHGTTNGWPW